LRHWVLEFLHDIVLHITVQPNRVHRKAATRMGMYFFAFEIDVIGKRQNGRQSLDE
jgi:hypothetical protein